MIFRVFVRLYKISSNLLKIRETAKLSKTMNLIRQKYTKKLRFPAELSI